MKTKIETILLATVCWLGTAMLALSAETNQLNRSPVIDAATGKVTWPATNAPDAKPGVKLTEPPTKLAAPSDAPYKANQFTISPFTGLTTPTLKLDDAKQFTGLEVGYYLTSAIEATAEAAATDTDGRAIDQFGAHGRGYLPLWKSGFAFYGEVGWQRFNEDTKRDFLSTGAGVALRAKQAGVRFGLRKLDDFKRGDLLQILLAAELRF